MGQGQDTAADHGHSAHETRVDQDEVALQGLWEGGEQEELPRAEPTVHAVSRAQREGGLQPERSSPPRARARQLPLSFLTGGCRVPPHPGREHSVHPSPMPPGPHLLGLAQTEGRRGPSPPAARKHSSELPPTPPWCRGSPAQTAPLARAPRAGHPRVGSLRQSGQVRALTLPGSESSPPLLPILPSPDPGRPSEATFQGTPNHNTPPSRTPHLRDEGTDELLVLG